MERSFEVSSGAINPSPVPGQPCPAVGFTALSLALFDRQVKGWICRLEMPYTKLDVGGFMGHFDRRHTAAEASRSTTYVVSYRTIAPIMLRLLCCCEPSTVRNFASANDHHVDCRRYAGNHDEINVGVRSYVGVCGACSYSIRLVKSSRVILVGLCAPGTETRMAARHQSHTSTRLKQTDFASARRVRRVRGSRGVPGVDLCLSRRDSVLLNRLRIGHTRLTHSFLLSVDDIPECGTCQCPLTVKHILVECVDLKDVRNKHFVASSIKDLFDHIEAHRIIDFITET